MSNEVGWQWCGEEEFWVFTSKPEKSEREEDCEIKMDNIKLNLELALKGQ